MQEMRWAHATGVIGLCLLGIPLLRLAEPRTPMPMSSAPTLLSVRPPRTPADRAVREAERDWWHAQMAVSRELEILEQWDPHALVGRGGEVWRVQQMDRDVHGDLRQALAAVHRAAGLARTPSEASRVAELSVILEHDSGHHEAELRQAQALVALWPRNAAAQSVLRKAILCPCRRRSGRVAHPGSKVRLVSRSSPRSASEAALREAKWCSGRAQMAAKPELEALAEADPYAAPGSEEGWRHRLMARDESGDLRRALAAAQRAVLLARTHSQEYQATVWLALIECDRGYPTGRS
jgi:hypothetical protein